MRAYTLVWMSSVVGWNVNVNWRVTFYSVYFEQFACSSIIYALIREWFLYDNHILLGEFIRSARSLSSSHTPTAGSFIAQRMSPSHHSRISIEEPLLGGHISTQAPPSTNTKTMLCLVSSLTRRCLGNNILFWFSNVNFWLPFLFQVPIMIFLTTFNFHHSNSEHDMVFEKPNKGFVIQVRRKLLQVVQATILFSFYADTLLGSREHRRARIFEL